MSGWRKVSLGDALSAESELQTIKAAFVQVTTQQQADAAVFIRHENEGGVHCNVIVYFSPAAADLAQQFNAKACMRPSADGLSLLIGSLNAHEWMFS